MHGQAGKRAVLDYFDAKNELKKIEKNKKASKLEVQKIMGETSSELASNSQSTPTAYPHKISLHGFGVSVASSNEVSAMTPMNRPLQNKLGYQTPIQADSKFKMDINKMFGSAQKSQLTGRNQIVGSYAFRAEQP